MNPKIQKLIDDHIDRLTSSLMFEVEATLRSVEFYSQRIPDLAEWLCGDLTIDPGGRIVGDYLLKDAPLSGYILLWFLSWRATNGDLRIRATEYLDLRNQGVCEFPPSFSIFDRLRGVRLEGNPIASLPDNIGQISIDLSQLSRIGLILQNAARMIDIRLCVLASQTELDVELNKVRQIPNVTALHFDNLGMDSIPTWVHWVEGVEHLSLTGNQLRRIPSWLNTLSSLKSIDLSKQSSLFGNTHAIVWDQPPKVSELNLSNTPFEELPEWLSKCTDLEVLSLSDCSIRKLPHWLQELENIQLIDVSLNPLEPETAVMVLQFLPNLTAVILSKEQQQLIIEMEMARPDIELEII